MCLPTKNEQPPSSGATGAISIFGIGGPMLLACLAGPILAGALGGIGAGILLGAAGGLFALALCAAVPAIFIAQRRRSTRRAPTPER